MIRICFTVPGIPVPKERPRMTRTGHTYTPKRTKDYEKKVLAHYIQEVGSEPIAAGVPLCMRVYAYYPIPKNASKVKREAMLAGNIRPTKRPDADNILKSIADALNGNAYCDDSQIVAVTVEKWYSIDPRVEVTILEDLQ